MSMAGCVMMHILMGDVAIYLPMSMAGCVVMHILMGDVAIDLPMSMAGCVMMHILMGDAAIYLPMSMAGCSRLQLQITNWATPITLPREIIIKRTNPPCLAISIHEMFPSGHVQACMCTAINDLPRALFVSDVLNGFEKPLIDDFFT